MRIDRLLFERGLSESRARARAAIAAGRVTADEVIVAKPSDEVSADAVLCAEPAHPWVSRGGVKLAAALDHFGIDPSGRVCLDVGASTGGFTDCLLQRGAARVYAIDVGHGQLDWKIRNDLRVVVREKVNARFLSRAEVPEEIDICTIDVS